MKKTSLILLMLLFFIEIIYFNIVFDLVLVLFLFLVSFGASSFVRNSFFGIDKVLVNLSVGLGLVGASIWLSTFYNFNYKSFYLILSLIVIYCRKEYILDTIKSIKFFSLKIYDEHFSLLTVLFLFFMFYIISASAPIDKYDSLIKHIVIPYKILHSSHYDYNVIESIVFGDYALFGHMLYLYLLALGGTKALVLLNTTLSFLILITLIRIGCLFVKDNLLYISIALVYLSVSLYYSISTILYTDIVVLYYIIMAYFVMQYCSLFSIRKNLYTLALISGIALFTKQTAFFYLIPLILYLFYIAFKSRKYLVLNDLSRALIALVIFFVLFMPPLILIYYKTGNPLFPFMNNIFRSEYFSMSNFADPFAKNPLRLDTESLKNIVFNTNRNIEMIGGGVGYYLLFIPMIMCGLFIKKLQKRYMFLFLGVVLSYWISLKFTYNIRYFVGSMMLLIPILLVVPFYFARLIRFLIFACILVIVYFQAQIIFLPDNYYGFKNRYIIPDGRLVDIANESVLGSIKDKKNIFILSNNDVFRGLTNNFYALNWYNTFLLEQLTKDLLSPQAFLSQFDYYLIDKRFPLFKWLPSMFPDSLDIKDMLEIYQESESHILYKVKKQFRILKNEKFDTPISVSVSKPQIRTFKKEALKYQIQIEASALDDNTVGRFQINWQDADGKFISASLIPYKLTKEKVIYTSPVIDAIPQNAILGVLYLNSHSENMINIYSFKLLNAPNDSFLKNKLEIYNQKFPYLMKVVE